MEVGRHGLLWNSYSVEGNKYSLLCEDPQGKRENAHQREKLLDSGCLRKEDGLKCEMKFSLMAACFNRCCVWRAALCFACSSSNSSYWLSGMMSMDGFCGNPLRSSRHQTHLYTKKNSKTEKSNKEKTEMCPSCPSWLTLTPKTYSKN